MELDKLQNLRKVRYTTVSQILHARHHVLLDYLLGI